MKGNKRGREKETWIDGDRVTEIDKIFEEKNVNRSRHQWTLADINSSNIKKTRLKTQMDIQIKL